MKPIEKYQQQFIGLLKEAEKELGGNLTVKVTSTETDACLGHIKDREYKCSISTVNDFLL